MDWKQIAKINIKIDSFINIRMKITLHSLVDKMMKELELSWNKIVYFLLQISVLCCCIFSLLYLCWKYNFDFGFCLFHFQTDKINEKKKTYLRKTVVLVMIKFGYFKTFKRFKKHSVLMSFKRVKRYILGLE